jgi:enamine deaminase RidA (YjgF/YER057c/UK114 family)
VGRLQQVGHFMHYKVLKAFLWLSGQVGIEPDARGAGTAATPLSFSFSAQRTVPP